MHTTDDPSDPRLTRGPDTESREQAEVYLVLSDDERAKGFVRPVRTSYRHLPCGAVTTMGNAIAETFARNPAFYGNTLCVSCRMHKPLSEFVWDDDDSTMGS